MGWTSLTYAYGSVLTSTKMTQTQDNSPARAQGLAGAPSILTAAIANSNITTAKIADINVTTAKIANSNITTAKIAQNAVVRNSISANLQQNTGILIADATIDIELTGGVWSFNALWASTPMMVDFYSYVMNGYTTAIRAHNTGGATTITYYMQCAYINASAPYNIGGGRCHDFIYLQVDGNGDIIGDDLAGSPPWAYNGPTKTTADRYDDNGKQYIRQLVLPAELTNIDVKNITPKQRVAYYEALAEHRKNPVYEEIELTPVMKNADMDLLPHPWPGYAGNIVLLDPTSPMAEKLTQLRENGNGENNGEDILRAGHLIIDNVPLDRKGPKGLAIIGAKWRDT